MPTELSPAQPQAAPSSIHRWAVQSPHRPALTFVESGQVISFGDLHRAAARLAQWLAQQGLVAGDTVALLLENQPRLIELALAARWAGLYYTTINTHLTAREAAHILSDSGAKLLFASNATRSLADTLMADPSLIGIKGYTVDGTDRADVAALDVAKADISDAAPIALSTRPVGRDLMYSSGTTGLPKGIKKALLPATQRDQPDREVHAWQQTFGFDARSVYLSTAPLYHAAPLRYVLRTLDVGGHCIVMANFEPESTLAAIERFGVTHSQWVPTMFVRLLRLPDAVRKRYNLSSMRMAVHAAAPCPVPVKQAMLDWWGDVIFEFYAGTEGLGATSITPQEWRAHPGSVGRSMLGTVHIADSTGAALPLGEIGQVFFEGGPKFEYHNDPEKTLAAYNSQGWASYGDLGYLDAEGYLYLADRRADLIVSGGINLYPQEIENALLLHPAVADAAVIGIPDDELGEKALAIVSLRTGAAGLLANAETAALLREFLAANLSRQKWPRSIVFESDLPRTEAGKLLRRLLKEQYRTQPEAGYPLEAATLRARKNK